MPTMANVAERAGVSVATVSRALSGSGAGVSPAVLDRVTRAVEELGYNRNNLARNMRVGTSRIIGLVISDVGNPFFTAVARGAEDVAQEQGYSLVLANTDENPVREAASLDVMAAERAAGVIVATTNQVDRAIARLAAIPIPIVAIDRRIESLRTDTVAIDNESAAYEAVSLLVRLGHRQIAMVGAPEGRSTADERVRGYLRALRENRLPMSSDMLQHGNFRESGGYENTLAVLALPERPTAIFSANNLTTLGAMRALRDRGVSVPDEVSLVGFDDIPGGDLMNPPITVVQQPTYQLGSRAVDLLFKRLADPAGSIQEVVLPAVLLNRGSTARPRD